MPSESALEYARCHGLALDYLSESRLIRFKPNPHDGNGASLRLREPFVPEYDELLLEDKLQVIPEALLLLATAVEPGPSPDWAELLEDHNGKTKLKAEAPLLVSDHERDLKWFQKGLDLPKLMRDHVSTHSLQGLETDNLRDVLENSKDLSTSIHAEVAEERLQMTQESMNVLAACVFDRLPEKDIEEIMHCDLPMDKSHSIEPLIPLLSSQLADEEKNHRFPPLPPLALEPRSEIELDADNIVLQLEKTGKLQDQICASDIETGSPSKVRAILNRASVTPPTDHTQVWDISPVGAGTSTPGRNHINEIRLEVPIVHSPPGTEKKSRYSKRASFKDLLGEFIDLSPRLETNSREFGLEEGKHNKHWLQNLDQYEDQVNKDIECGELEINEKALRVEIPAIGKAASVNPRTQVSAKEMAVGILSHVQINPINTTVEDETRLNWVPIPHELMHLELAERMEDSRLSDYTVKPDKVVRSEQLLYKEPGLRTLEVDAEDDEEMEQDQKLDSDARTGTLTSIIPQKRSAEHSAIQSSGTRPSQVLYEDSPINENDLPAVGKPTTSVPGRQEIELSPEQVVRFHQDCSTQVEADDIMEPVTQAKKMKCGMSPRHQRNQDFAYRFSPGGSLDSFLDLRGGKFKNPELPINENRQEQNERVGKSSEILTDPICISQTQTPPKLLKSIPWLRSGSLRRPHEQIEVPCTPLEQVNAEDKMSHPEIRQLNEQRTMIVDSALVNNRLLIAFIEEQGHQHLTVIYRDLRGLPDVILNPKSCIIYTNLQAITQKTLPGRKTKSYTIQDRIRSLAGSFDTIFVLVSFCVRSYGVDDDSQMKAMADFGIFCGCLSMSSPNGDVVPLWMPIHDSESSLTTLDNPLCRWTWELICRHAFQNIVVIQMDGLRMEQTLVLIQEETLWELFLCKAGMNSMAAQVVLGWLKKPGERNESEVADKGCVADSERAWGLGKFVSMPSEQRLKLFGGDLGLNAMHRINGILDRSTNFGE